MGDADRSFRTDRLIVRRFTADDWRDLQEIGRDMAASGGSIYDHAWPTSEKGARGMAEWLADGQRVIGLVAINDVDDQGAADLGHMFHTAYRNKGLDTEAVRCMVELAFADPKVRLVKAGNAVEWPGQLAPLVELGFTETDRGPASFAKDAEGKPIEFTACRMEMTREDWQSRTDAAG